MTKTKLDVDDRLMTINEVAAYCSVHRAWVYRAMNNGALPYVLVGARRRVRMSDLVHYLEIAS